MITRNMLEKRLARRMVRKLLTMPDCTEVSTTHMVGITYGLSPSDSKWLCVLKHPLFFQLLFVDLFALHSEFHREARRKGFVVDGSEYYNTLAGMPYNIPKIFRRRENISMMFEKCERKEIFTNSDIHYYIRELVTKDDISCATMQLMRIPPGCQTGHIDNTKYRSAAFVLDGEGCTEYSYWEHGYFYDDDHDGEEAIWRELGERQEMKDCISVNSLCSYPCNARGIEGPQPNVPWFSLTNTGKEDFILFIVKINDFLDD